MKQTLIWDALLRPVMIGIMVLGANAIPAHALTAPNSFAQWLQQPVLQFGDTAVSTDKLRDFYAGEGWQPLWVDASGLTPRASQALEVIARADEEGLSSQAYGINTIRSVAGMPRNDPEMLLRVRMSLEVLMSNAVMRYAADMQGGMAHPQWDTGKPAMTRDDALALLRQTAAADDTAAFLTAMEPSSPQYAALKGALQHYQSIAAQGGWPDFTPGKMIKPGMHDPRVVALKQILAVNGDMPAPRIAAVDDYDPATVEAIKTFQERHGINISGTVDAATQAALSVPVSGRIKQIAMTLERMRWMPKDLGGRYVLVNIPSYTLTAVSDGKSLAMSVIVGKAKTQTPRFSKNITDIVFNPSWGVPAKIAVNEILPKIKKDPDYLTNAGYTVIETRGGAAHAVDPHDIDWQAVGRGNFTYSFRQNPGDGNALGKVKFNIPDSDDIYLHDTSQHGLFARAERSLSHGCVRLADPKALTEFILTHEGWSQAKIEETYDSATSRTVRITPLPVHIVYWTSWVDDRGRAHFGRDIYGMDKKLLTAMGMPDKQDAAVKISMN